MKFILISFYHWLLLSFFIRENKFVTALQMNSDWYDSDNDLSNLNCETDQTVTRTVNFNAWSQLPKLVNSTQATNLVNISKVVIKPNRPLLPGARCKIYLRFNMWQSLIFASLCPPYFIKSKSLDGMQILPTFNIQKLFISNYHLTSDLIYMFFTRYVISVL
jgi:hypothetical protein